MQKSEVIVLGGKSKAGWGWFFQAMSGVFANFGLKQYQHLVVLKEEKIVVEEKLVKQAVREKKKRFIKTGPGMSR